MHHDSPMRRFIAAPQEALSASMPTRTELWEQMAGAITFRVYTTWPAQNSSSKGNSHFVWTNYAPIYLSRFLYASWTIYQNVCPLVFPIPPPVFLSSISAASSTRPIDIYDEVRLCIVDKVSGCLSPSISHLVSSVLSSISAASCNRLSDLYDRARLCIVLKVSGCLCPSITLLDSNVLSSNSAASVTRSVDQ